jgi:hypothetical protein
MGIELFAMRFIIEVHDIGTEIFMGSSPPIISSLEYYQFQKSYRERR